MMNIKFESTTFEQLDEGDLFQETPVRDGVYRYMKLGDCVFVHRKGMYNAAVVNGNGSKKKFKSDSHVYKVSRLSNEEEG